MSACFKKFQKFNLNSNFLYRSLEISISATKENSISNVYDDILIIFKLIESSPTI